MIQGAIVQADPRAELMNELNRLRSVGCACAPLAVPALALDARLEVAAQRHTEEMASRDVLDHVGSGGTSAFDRVRAAGFPNRAAAENIASGNTDPRLTLYQWVYSLGHCETMMSALYTHAGIGHAIAPSGRHYWTLDLATPW
jgi:uncharacterized protein YkwD